MRKRLLFILLFFLVGATIIYFITSPKVEKWTYDLLPNGYSIQKTSEVDIVLGKYINGSFSVNKNGKRIGVEDYIAEFQYGKRYIALKCLEPVIEGVKVKFYMIDSENEDVYGPYDTEEVYLKVAEKIVDEKLGDWIETITKPKGAVNQ